MINIKETLKVPSAALQAMVDGLREQDERKDFKVDMGTFGAPLFSARRGRADICLGCAATCTVQKIAGKNLTADIISHREYRAEVLGFDHTEFAAFERAMDQTRCGSVTELFDFFVVPQAKDVRPSFRLLNGTWRGQLRKVEAYIKELQAQGL